MPQRIWLTFVFYTSAGCFLCVRDISEWPLTLVLWCTVSFASTTLSQMSQNAAGDKIAMNNYPEPENSSTFPLPRIASYHLVSLEAYCCLFSSPESIFKTLISSRNEVHIYASVRSPRRMGFRQPGFVLYQADGKASICLPLRGVGMRNAASFSFKMHSWCLYFGWALLVRRLIAVLAALRKTGSRCNQYDHPASVGDSRAQRRAIHQRSSRPRVYLDHTALHTLQMMCINKKVVLISCSSSEVYSILFLP